MCIDEPVFGCYLDQACGGASHSTGVGKVPLFVQRCVSLIESSEENMQTDGLYRASGNLSQIQKIRLQVKYNLHLFNRFVDKNIFNFILFFCNFRSIKITIQP